MENNILEMETLENATKTSENTELSLELASPVLEVNQKKYEFRKLKATDIGLMTRVISKIGVNKIKGLFKSDDIKDIISSKSGDSDLTMAVGIEIVSELIQIILEVYENVETDLHKLLSDVSNLQIEEVQNLEMDEFLEMLFDFFKKKEFLGFFNRALQLLGLAD